MKIKVKEWLKRYLPANLVSLIFTLLFFKIALALTHNPIIASLAGAIIGENLGYYGTILIRDTITDRNKHRQDNQPYTRRSWLKLIRNLILEFGPAELLDSYLIRPALLYLSQILFTNQILGLIVAKHLADIIFYLPTITAYELRKKYLP